ncbi:MAG: ribosome silencing factor [Candidatus Hydrogenedentes bacterium]|nr:ribosome silencing factor [Candidatus Hydrogenedentota bacterium]
MGKLVRKKTETSDLDSLPNARRIAQFAADHKASDIKGYDVRGLTVVADSFVLCSASSEPQVRAIFNTVKAGMKSTVGKAPLRTEGTPSCGWLVMDYGSVIFHIFRVEAREFYDLDGLWADAPELDLDVDV